MVKARNSYWSSSLELFPDRWQELTGGPQYFLFMLSRCLLTTGETPTGRLMSPTGFTMASEVESLKITRGGVPRAPWASRLSEDALPALKF